MEDLDERIRQAERRLVAREHALGERIDALGRRLRRALRPGRLAGPVLGLAGVLLVVGWGAGARGGRPAPSPGPQSSPTEPWWARVVALGWPLLPSAWRARAGPAAAMLALGLAAGRRQPPPRVAPSVDLRRYAGTWFEIARLPTPSEGTCTGQPSATYIPRGEFIEVHHRCPGPDGSLREARGLARAVRGSGGARLKVSLLPRWLRWLPGAWTDQWILHVDPGYTMALVGSPGRQGLWVLARRRSLSAQQLQGLMDIGRAQGFAVDRLQIVQPG
jgi:apolipoprotein D and lipocalin family protein